MGYLQEPRRRMNPASKAFIGVGVLAILAGVVVFFLGSSLADVPANHPDYAWGQTLSLAGAGMFAGGIFLYFLGRFLVFLIDQ